MHSKVEESLTTMGGIASKIDADLSLQEQKDKVRLVIFSATLVSSFEGQICFYSESLARQLRKMEIPPYFLSLSHPLAGTNKRYFDFDHL